jgi:hypothetical protein
MEILQTIPKGNLIIRVEAIRVYKNEENRAVNEQHINQYKDLYKLKQLY